MPTDFSKYGVPVTASSATAPAAVTAKTDFSKYGIPVASQTPTADVAPATVEGGAPAPSPVKGGFVGDLLSGSTQRFGQTIGSALAAPHNADLYAQALAQHNLIVENTQKAIANNKAQGKDTSRLEATLANYPKPTLEEFTGDVINKTPEQVVGEGVGTGLEALSGGLLSGGKSVVAKGLSPLAKIGQGAKIGGTFAAVGGASNAMQNNEGVGDVLKDTAISGTLGSILGGGLGAGSAVFAKGARLLNPVAEDVIKKRTQALYDIENNYAKTRKAIDFSKDAGQASRARIASTDVLTDAVDRDGLIRTTQDGGAVDKYRAMTIDNAEGVVRDLLKKEGASVTPDTVRAQLTKSIYDSGLQGKNLTNALRNVDNEVAGYMLKANPDGKIPLEIIHDAKIDTTKSINFQTPPEVATDRKAIASGLKKLVEDNSKHDITGVNGELRKYYTDLDLLKNLDGKRVKGGRLGKYAAQISGNIVGGAVGHAVGGPAGAALGTMVGGELGARVRGSILEKALGGVTGKTAPKSDILAKAVAEAKAPRLALPAPTTGLRSTQKGVGTIIPPLRTQSAIDAAEAKARATGVIKTDQSNILGKRNISQSTPITPTIIPPKVMPKIIAKTETSVKPLSVEATKYKTPEEFIKAQPVVYHGTNANLKQFNNKTGTFFTDDMMNADGYAGGNNVYEGHLNLQKPLVIDAKGRLYNDLQTPYGKSTQEVVGNVDNKKYDGVIFKNIKDSFIDDAEAQEPGTIYYAFKPRDSFLNDSQLTEIWNKANKGMAKKPTLKK